MARPLRPLINSGGYYPSRRWIPLVRGNGYTTQDGGEEQVVWKTVTGTLIHITDALASPMQKCEVSLEPIQDLNGQDAPYPAGGGKNKLQPVMQTRTVNGITLTVQSDGSYIATETATGTATFSVGTCSLPAGEYVLNGLPEQGQLNITFRYALVVNGSESQKYNLENNFTLSEDSSVEVKIQFFSGYVASSTVFKPMIRLASVTDNTFAPYSNICPITGWTGCEVWNDPKYGGLINWAQYLNVSSVANSLGLSFTKGANGYLKITGTTEANDYKNLDTISNSAWRSGHIAVMVATPELPEGFALGATSYISNFNHASRYTAQISPSGYWYPRISFKANTPINWEGYINVFDITEMFGEGNEPTLENFLSMFPNHYDYSVPTETTVSAVNGDPYQHLSVTFPDSAGTVYGGTVDLVSGVLTVNKKYATFADIGQSGWYGISASNLFYTNKYTDKINPTDNTSTMLCSMLPYNGVQYAGGMVSLGLYQSYNKTIYIKDTSCEDTSAFYLKYSNAQIVYELAEPLTYQLTPQEISTLAGENNIWGDGTIELTYKAQAE